MLIGLAKYLSLSISVNPISKSYQKTTFNIRYIARHLTLVAGSAISRKEASLRRRQEMCRAAGKVKFGKRAA